MNLCFYCNKNKPDKVYTSRQGGHMRVHSHCVSALQKLIGVPIFERKGK